MKSIVSALISLSLITSVIAEEANLATRLFHSNPTALALADGGITGPGKAAPESATGPGGKDPKSLQPGKALLLSAIVPGAGEYYAGYKLRAAAFFAIEIAAWVAVISYYNQGMDKDKEFKDFADDHFVEQVYRDVEYSLAQNPEYGDSAAYTGTKSEWLEEEWDVKIHYLPDRGFTHELPDDRDRSTSRSHYQQYYEMIGKYIHQFGFAWDDVFVMFNDPVVSYNGDNPGTPEYDDEFGAARLSKLYMDMRYDSNQLLDKSSLAIQIVMLNHVASALHASFTVKTLRQSAKANVGFRTIDYDGRKVGVGGLNFAW